MLKSLHGVHLCSFVAYGLRCKVLHSTAVSELRMETKSEF